MDREKVIKGLECCRLVYESKPFKNCPYSNGCECGDCDINQLHYDALALLKEQKTANLYKCQNCGTWVSAENVVRCKDCKFFNDYFVECEKNNHTHGAAWFCADGQRAENAR